MIIRSSNHTSTSIISNRIRRCFYIVYEDRLRCYYSSARSSWETRNNLPISSSYFRCNSTLLGNGEASKSSGVASLVMVDRDDEVDDEKNDGDVVTDSFPSGGGDEELQSLFSDIFEEEKKAKDGIVAESYCDGGEKEQLQAELSEILEKLFAKENEVEGESSGNAEQSSGSGEKEQLQSELNEIFGEKFFAKENEVEGESSGNAEQSSGSGEKEQQQAELNEIFGEKFFAKENEVEGESSGNAEQSSGSGEKEQLQSEFSEIFGEEIFSKEKEVGECLGNEEQTRENALLLFDFLAPHLEVKTLKKITDKVVQLITSMENIDPADHRTTLKKKLHSVFHFVSWVEPLLFDFLNNDKSRKNAFTTPRYMLKNVFYTPNMNKQDFDQDVQVLMQARQVAISEGLKWGGRSGAAAPLRRSNARVAAMLHTNKSDRMLEEEAVEMAHLLADRLPAAIYRKLMHFLKAYSEEESRVMKNFFPKIRQKVHTHVHLISLDLANFFYIQDIPLSIHRVNDISKLKGSDPRLVDAWQAWDNLRERTADTMLEAQKKLFQIQKNHAERASSEEDADPVEELQQTMDSLDQSRPFKPYFNFAQFSVQFDEDYTIPNFTAPSPYIVFLQNLPIDVTEEELQQIYSKCGPISSLQIYNLRPELDPGPLTPAKRKDLKKKQRASYQKRFTPRTPVFAKVEFATEKGFASATGPHLSIFGIVLRKHLVRSIPAPRLTSIYLENLPPNFYISDVYSLLSSLTPNINDINIIMADNTKQLHDIRADNIPSSQNPRKHLREIHAAEAVFKDFETAYWAYERLNGVEGREWDVHFMKTPEDAMEYWTREKIIGL